MRILFITATRIGDAVISTGILRYLVDRYPGARITVACGPLAASLFASVPGIEKVVILEKKLYGGHWLALWAEVIKERWGLVVDLRRSLISYLVRAQERARLGYDNRRLHRVEFLSTVFELDTPSPPKIWISPQHEIQARLIVPDGSPVVAVAPFAARPEKTWPIDYFLELVTRLVSAEGLLPNSRILAIGAEEDRESLEAFLAGFALEKRLTLIGCPDLLTVFAAIKRSHLGLANDSGIAHLAAATGQPTLALFGPTQPELYRPYGAKVAIARPPGGEFVRQISDLTVDMAYAATKTLLN